MKTTFIFTKKILCVILSFTLLTLSLVACANPTDGTKETTTAETIYVPESGEPSEELLEQIKKDYYQFCYGTSDGYNSETSVHIEGNYGVYNSCAVLLITCPNLGYEDWLWHDTIANAEFYYRNGNEIKVWKNSTFLSLKEAYNQKILKQEDLLEIANLHNEWKNDIN